MPRCFKLSFCILICSGKHAVFVVLCTVRTAAGAERHCRCSFDVSRRHRRRLSPRCRKERTPPPQRQRRRRLAEHRIIVSLQRSIRFDA